MEGTFLTVEEEEEVPEVHDPPSEDSEREGSEGSLRSEVKAANAELCQQLD